ncbi:hypothetical protein MTBPR1_90035 [Candidatus Terasakiella magnetica]|uniref:Response regulatory domain-containing protein n=1 Tax=Candidatus Terasakiella magnetica TaxID=1867952 RepID=A0A1C3RLS7_9PROT|nr:pentapeptide repeat-containing protein [Candidatus Terasakiella magnetica]SCA58188.1 hypothetical protein MTBPR1_90035 [Candidatus Terasakiella magnetica]
MSDFDFSAYKVMLCDNDPASIDAARTTYLDNGIGDFVATPSPEEALDHIPMMKPDLMLIGLKFPEISGIEVVRQIRGLMDGAFFKTPILILLDKVAPNTLREACKAGIEGALRKPLEAEKILRFSRSVILKPRRFVCVNHYFGPERRTLEDIERSKELCRRKDGIQAPVQPGRSSLDSSPVMSGGFKGSSIELFGNDAPAPAATKPTPPKQAKASDVEAAEVSNLTQEAPSSARKAERVVQHEASSHSRGAAGATLQAPSSQKSSGSIFAGEDTAQGKKTSNDFALTDDAPAKQSKEDFDFGLAEEEKKKAKSKQENLIEEEAASKKKAQAKVALEEAEKKAKKKKKETEAGPADEDFEEIVDLEECLEQHKEWINSGGKNGKRAKRPHSDFRGQEIAEVDFTGAILPQSCFEGLNCTSTVFRKADLSGSTFKEALLSSSDLRVARLSKVDMRNAKLDRSDMLGADLSEADLAGASLRRVNLSGANLHQTNLCGVNLTSVQGLIAEQVKRAITDSTTRLPSNLNMAP